MALVPTILRRSLSLSRVSISAVRLIAGDSHFNCNCPSCTSTALKKPNLYRHLVVPSFPVRHFSASPALTRPSHDESLLKVIDDEIACAVESNEDNEVVVWPCYLLFYNYLCHINHYVCVCNFFGILYQTAHSLQFIISLKSPDSSGTHLNQ